MPVSIIRKSRIDRPVFFLDNMGHLNSNMVCFKRYAKEYPMAAKNMLDEIERKVRSRFEREMAAIAIFRESGTLDQADVSANVLGFNALNTEGALEQACERIISDTKGYLRLADIIQKLQESSIGLSTSGAPLRRRIRRILTHLESEGKIRINDRKGRGGSTYLSIKESTKEKAS